MDVLELVSKYLFSLAKKGLNMVGYYQQGSAVSGLQDKHSDYDFIVIWKNSVPKIAIRRKVTEKLGCKVHDARDIPSVKKSIEALGVDNKILNIAHIQEKDFFNFYKELQDPASFNPDTFVRLDGLSNAKIIYDPSKKISLYKNSIKVTPEIRNIFKNYIKSEIEHDLKMLEVSTERKGVANYIGYLHDLVENLNILFALSDRKFPGSMKWFEVLNKNELGSLMKELEKRINKEDVTGKILKIAGNFGFKPSKEIKA
ncbi:hypothetical protein A2715_05475 [Candidatus Woesebacteria bacterium RIFCSPHIGHO2_01_FULL_39_32]|uniref:Polymerase nucleotidyl transferase domain-containing protein n=1 Tax=Candidatus Woesebacteria bacterium RIFCSPLOWO2_01_FULL_39_25 TaxID=1802521 RepID=A0A1F8BLN9_9BACT|nr:MAG: hypothetical protein A2124_03920 [Candidatus Woesebacteria bacterium GWB1_37_5]OGM25470.1 MAG: hypothetical protein A2715_05475 [Candidatus Woesebacteria bacterium RIFCSPHIGHO2_01_FULL_39_32]OGM38573.1 MAG: hypothetical protein A3F01_04430 [Candidatus Woesebacteria bacterium RIFCSPHIGHO2_12_FULL_38_11]OGM65001.1 MAG: hypothetical protein A2893_05085 [Candidatus Woesebacteria bacterium RIFCSPLOWO2_01_FULL_39_25]